MDNYEEELRRLLSEMQPSFQAQEMPQLTQGLLDPSNNQAQQQLQNLIGSSTQAANQMAQPQAPTGGADVAQRQAMAQQQAQQLLQQQQQRQAQAGNLLGTIASMFIPGGSILNYFEGAKG